MPCRGYFIKGRFRHDPAAPNATRFMWPSPARGLSRGFPVASGRHPPSRRLRREKGRTATERRGYSTTATGTVALQFGEDRRGCAGDSARYSDGKGDVQRLGGKAARWANDAAGYPRRTWASSPTIRRGSAWMCWRQRTLQRRQPGRSPYNVERRGAIVFVDVVIVL